MSSEVTIFSDARAIPDPADRAAYLDHACGGDAALRRRVDEWLAADAAAGAGGFLEPFTASHAPPGGPGGRVLAGRYKLVEPVGQGGMGSVWVAQQTEPVKRLVAVKLIKPGMDSGQVVARFEAERQALALMDHPNIARVLDAGQADDGRPFFVMELVKGVPITQFCDERRLTPRQRLELFVPVCRAVQHAHQKGVIHRDLKPSNVLVALYDDRPVPKVIDFGVAKATGEPLTDRTLHTGLAAVVGTPAYMAPEQATLNNLDVDTRADVYGLGALLYELLAGSPPFARSELQKAGLLEMLRVIREDEPPKPSARVSTAAGKPSIAAVRGTDPAALAGLLRSDLDWVVMKAIDKDRGRRYDTAAGFAADVERFLAGEPVNAAPPGGLYRARKFARRHRAGLLVAGLLLLAVAAGVAGVVRAEMAKTAAARDAADKARRLTGLLQRLLESADPEGAGGPEGTVGRMLDDHTPALWAELADQPAVEADLRLTVGRTYANLFQYDKATDHLQRAAELFRSTPKRADALALLALCLVESPPDRPVSAAELTDRQRRAVACADEAVALQRQAGPTEGLAVALMADALVRNLVANRGNASPVPMRERMQEAAAVARQCPGDGSRRVLAQVAELTANDLLWVQWKPAEAAAEAERALALRLADRGDAHLLTARARALLGACLTRARDWPRAEDQLRRSLATYAGVFADRPNPYASAPLWVLLVALANQHRDEDAAAVLAGLPPAWNAPALGFAGGDEVAENWAEACMSRGDFAAAERQARAALAAVPTGAADRRLAPSMCLAAALMFQRRPAAVNQALAEWRPVARRWATGNTLPDDRWQVAPLAAALLIHDPLDPADAALAQRLVERWQADRGDRPSAQGPVMGFLGLAAHHCQGHHREVIAAAPGVLADLPADLGHERRVTALYLAHALEQTGDPAAAERALREQVADAARRYGPADPQVASYRSFLAECLARRGRPTEAVEQYAAAFALLSAHPAAAGASLTNRRADLAGRLAALFPADSADGKRWTAERAKLPPGPPTPWLETLTKPEGAK